MRGSYEIQILLRFFYAICQFFTNVIKNIAKYFETVLVKAANFFCPQISQLQFFVTNPPCAPGGLLAGPAGGDSLPGDWRKAPAFLAPKAAKNAHVGSILGLL